MADAPGAWHDRGMFRRRHPLLRAGMLADAIPAGTMAAVAVIEHRWAIPLRDAIQRAGGMPPADAWLAPEDLASIGLGVR
jgi:hypothetical protein